jgi:hypothetical protein
MATASAHAIDHAATPAVLEKDLVYVTGKGGTGKTTVAAALGRAAAASGRRTLVCDLTGGRRAGRFRLAKHLWALSIDPHAALIEWLRTQPGGVLAAPVLGRSTAFTHFVDAAPGAKELVTIGKVVDLTAGYDLVIVDGPSTGHALGMLAAPQTVARGARVGPIGEQAYGVHDFLTDPDHTGYVGVTLPEGMSLHELLELERGLDEALGRSLDLIVVDGVYPDRFTNAEAEHLEKLARRSTAEGQLHEALNEHRRARSHAKRVRWLRRQTRVPVVTLPFVFGAEIGPAEHELLARRLVAGT